MTVHPSSAAPAGRGSAPLLAGLFVATAVLVAYGFWSLGGLPELASRHGVSIDATITYLFVTTGILFLLGHGVLTLFVLRYAGSAERAAPERGSPHASSKLEWRWALVPVLVMCVIAEGGVLIVGMPAFAQLYGEAPPDSFVVEVVGKQFEWLVHYPGPDGVFGRSEAKLVNDARNPIGLDKKDPAAKDDIYTRGQMHLPVGRGALIRLRALDVLHSFTVPQFRVKQDLIPGFLGRTQFEPTRTGQYELACAELCGLGHYRMRGFITVESQEEVDQWLSEQEPAF
ncbi:MAG: cytochrome-c oxidase [Planctomycetes bacterium]|nr:cytochrome-c oxidase [Planctomycetota bacterium]